MKPALIQTIANLADVADVPDIEYSSQEWKKIGQVIRVLRPFEEATRELSKHDACISQAIPIITSLIRSLEEEATEDVGVLTMKRALKTAMVDRFSRVESNEHYAVATLLDSRYKHHLFRDNTVLPQLKASIIEQLVQDLRENATEVSTYYLFFLTNFDLLCHQ